MRRRETPQNVGSARQVALWTRVFAVFDLPFVVWLAMPGLTGWLLACIQWIDAHLGYAGMDHVVSPLGWFGLHLAGIIGVLWALVRIIRPTILSMGLDALGRLLVAALVAYFVLMRDAPSALWIVFASESIGSVVQFRILYRSRERA